MEGQPPTPCWSNILKKPPQAPPSDHQATPASAYGGLVTSCKSTKGLVVAVVDANAIIEGGQSLANSADRFVSVPEVIKEIRDPTSRHSLNFLPFTVDILEPASDALKKVINFARATGDLQSLSDVDLKLIALAYTLEAQIHGTQHLRPSPPSIHLVNVKRLPEKDMPGWGSNVPNLEEWEALEHVADDGTNSTSKILPLKDLNLNVIPSDQHSGGDDMIGNGAGSCTVGQVDVHGQPKKFPPVKREVKIEGKMVADGVDATHGQFVEEAGDWQPAVSRSTRRRFLRRKSRRESSEASSELDGQNDLLEKGEDEKYDDIQCPDLLPAEILEEVPSGESNIIEGDDSCEEISSILHHMRLEEESLKALQDDGEKHIPTGCLNSSDLKETNDSCGNDETGVDEENDVKTCDEAEKLDLASEISESIGTPNMDDNSSEQSWTMRSLSESSVACITGDYAMQNVLLQIGLRLVAPGGKQIRELHRWVLKCHACFKVTVEIGRIFCPSCGNGGTLRKVAVTVSENGIILAARRPRVSIRGTKFSLPLPQGGRDAVTKNPILREDQIPSKYLRTKPKKKNKQDEDVFLADNIFLHHTDKKAPLQPPMRKALAVFSGRRNPNDNHFARVKH